MNPDHFQLLQQGVSVWNRQVEKDPGMMADLSNADLSRMDLRRVDFRETNLAHAKLQGADLEWADFVFANLEGANLVGCKLRKADFGEADLSSADLEGADLSFAEFHGTDLSHANLNEAILQETYFTDVDLTDVGGLEHCEHWGPSNLDHRTLAKSKGLTLDFLRACGLPDLLIDNLAALQGNAIQFYSCFISYSHPDEKFAQRLHADLQNRGIRCWYAPRNIQGGRKLHHQISEAIRVHDKLLLILSEHSMKSAWVATEFETPESEKGMKGDRCFFRSA